ncbi:MAG: DUF2339 domain-containing protein [Clostridiales bacterium]|nr:DUF2339 domain-containing protein [Clostridiales bacterium]
MDNNIKISILNYENKLLEYRKQLNDLIYEYNNQKLDSSVLNYKINYLQTEINYMNNQLDMLKNEISNMAQMQQASQIPLPQFANTMYKPELCAEPEFQAVTMQQSNMTQMSQIQQPPQLQATPQAKNKSKDLENVIGKSWMGIFASVLIFISFILFATLLAPFITDTIKMVAMYVVSILITAFGLFKLKAHNNKLYLAISSCGIGAVYISFLLTNFYFKAIGDIMLYVLILIWAVFVCYLSRWKDRIFQIIGQCGITIALLFGIILCINTYDDTKLLLLSLFFVVTATVFYMSSYSKEFHKNIVNNIFNCINVFQLWAGTYLRRSAIYGQDELTQPKSIFSDWTAYSTQIIAGILLVFLILQFVLFMTAKLREKNNDFAIFMILNTILTMLLVNNMTYMSSLCNNIRGVIFLLLGAALIAVIEKKLKNGDDGRIGVQIFTFPVFVVSVYMITFFQDHIGVSFVMLLIMLLGYYKNDNVYKYESILMALVYACLFEMKYPAEHFILGLLFFTVLAVCVYKIKEQYNCKFKLCSYMAGLFFIVVSLVNVLANTNLHYDISMTIMLSVIAVLNICAMKSGFVKNFQSQQIEKESLNVTRIINAILMPIVLFSVMGVDNEICHFILVLLAILIFMVNIKNLVAQNEGLLPGIYIGAKLTVLLVVILSSYEAANYVISISAFLLAIISIVIGFRFFIKSFRIYGLFLSMVSVAKLIMIDISYENTLGHALSFFVCGILCFVISMIYHMIDRRIQTSILSFRKMQ